MIMVTNSEQDGLLVDSIDFWIDTFVKFYKDLQMDSFTFWPANESSEQVELFAKKVVPRVRENTRKISTSKIGEYYNHKI